MEQPVVTEQQHAADRPSRTARLAAWLMTERGVVTTAVALVVAQLAYRAWAVFGSWFLFDDFVFMSWVQTDGIGPSSLFQGYGGHLMPGGLLATWANLHLAHLHFSLTAVELLGMIALADVGAIVFLLSAFGRRPGVLPPLVIYLFTVLTLPTSIWWAVGINQTPLLIAIFWAGWTHLSYLRSGRFRWAVATMAITVAALAFQEKSLYIYWLFAFLAVGYFASGDVLGRVRSVVARYRAGVILYGVVAVGYLAVYLEYGRSFDPAPSNQQPLASIAGRMAGTTYATGILGGPYHWDTSSEWPLAQPNQLLSVLAVGLIAVLVYHLSTVRQGAKRAVLLAATPLAVDIVLVTAARATLGPYLALEYRYVTELAAFTAIALALATMPLRGADEQLATVRRSEFVDRPLRVATATAAVAVLGLMSSTAYVHHWHDLSKGQSYTYVNGVADTLRDAKEPIPLVDGQVPLFVMWAYNYPRNTLSHVFDWLSPHAQFQNVRTDQIHQFYDDGTLGPLLIDPVRHAAPSAGTSCPYPAKGGSVTVPLDGPLLGNGWWSRAAYYVEQDSPLEITAGDDHYVVTAKKGLHSLFFVTGGDRVDDVTFSGIDAGARFCLSELEVGSPVEVAP